MKLLTSLRSIFAFGEPNSKAALELLISASDAFSEKFEALKVESLLAAERREVFAAEITRYDALKNFSELPKGSRTVELACKIHSDFATATSEVTPAAFKDYTVESLEAHRHKFADLNRAFDHVVLVFKTFKPKGEIYAMAFNCFKADCDLFRIHTAAFLDAAEQAEGSAIREAVRVAKGAIDSLILERTAEGTPSEKNTVRAISAKAKNKKDAAELERLKDEAKIIAAIARIAVRKIDSIDGNRAKAV